MSNYAIDTAARFGEIPFVEFTKELVSGVFETLLEAHVEQMEGYTKYIATLTQDLSTYINNTIDNVSFEEISDFVTNYPLPKLTDENLTAVLGALKAPDTSKPDNLTGTNATESGKWWQGLINSVGPAVSGLVDKIKDPNLATNLTALDNYNNSVLNAPIPTYKEIHQSIASLIASNKYGLLQNIAKMGLLRLVVTEGHIITRISFSTWNTSTSGSETSQSEKNKTKVKEVRGGGIISIFGFKNKSKQRVVTINTAKSYQRDSSGTSVNIFGEVKINFKTDYAPLNG